MFTTTTNRMMTIEEEVDLFFAAENAAKSFDHAAAAFAAGHCVPAACDTYEYEGEDFANLLDTTQYVVCTDIEEDCPF